ncbi:MAG: PEGA domain-containing protein [Candidatus Gracilibacteria bacterium]
MTRRFLFRLFVRLVILALFVAAVVILVLLAYGYRWDRAENKLESTGIVTIDGTYRGIQILIDGQIIARNLPVSISGVREGYHRLEVVKDGYLSWSQNLQVTSGLVTSVPFVILLPKNVATTTKSVLSTTKLFKNNPELVAASSSELLFKDGSSYAYVDILTSKKTQLLFPKNVEGAVFDLTSQKGYGFSDGFLKYLAMDLKTKSISVQKEEPFPYSRDGLSFVQFSKNFGEFLFLKGGEITSIRTDMSQPPHLFTRLAETVNRLSWYYDTKHFVLQVAQKLEFCDESFTNCYILRSLADHDSFAVTREGIMIYDSKAQRVLFLPLFSGESAFLSYIFSEKVSL